MAYGIARHESPSGTNPISFEELLGLMTAVEIMGSVAGYLGTGGFCFGCWGTGKLIVTMPGSLFGAVPVDCFICNGDGSMLA